MRWIALAAVFVLALGAVADLVVSLHLWLFWDGGRVGAADYLGVLLRSVGAGFQGLDWLLQSGFARDLLEAPAQIYFPIRALVLAVLALLMLGVALALRRRS